MLESQRVRLRQWRVEDHAPYAALNADSEVMRFFPSVLSREESDAQARLIHNLIEERGWGFWAAEYKETGEFMGFVGLHSQAADSGIPQAPLVEVGWRLARKFWGQGLAPEAAELALRFAFEELEQEKVFAFTALPNQPSRRVMEKLGMTNEEQDFEHPKIPDGNPLKRHCLYGISREKWQQKIVS